MQELPAFGKKPFDLSSARLLPVQPTAMDDNQKEAEKKMKKLNQVKEREQRRKKRGVSATKTLANLPNEIKDEILLRLPVRTLWKLRYVIKDYSRFHNPNFIQMHFHRQLEINNASNFIVTTRSFIYKINIQNLIPVVLKFPFNIGPVYSYYDSDQRTRVILACSCNGLLCLTRLSEYGRVVFLWNPVTNNCKRLPINKIARGTKFALGLGHDYDSGKFKVVAISRERRGKNPRFEAFVNTVGTSSWRSIGEAQRLLWEPNPQNSRPRVFEGCPHWIVPSSKSIVSFSVGDEKFNEIPMTFLDNGEAEIVDFALGNQLSVFSYVVKLKRYDLWVRLENTWTKHVSFNELNMTGFRDRCQHNGYYGYKDAKLYGGSALLDPVINIIKIDWSNCKLAEPFYVFPYAETIAAAKERDDELSEDDEEDFDDHIWRHTMEII